MGEFGDAVEEGVDGAGVARFADGGAGEAGDAGHGGEEGTGESLLEFEEGVGFTLAPGGEGTVLIWVYCGEVGGGGSTHRPCQLPVPAHNIVINLRQEVSRLEALFGVEYRPHDHRQQRLSHH